MRKINLAILVTFFLFITACAGNLNNVATDNNITVEKLANHPVINAGVLIAGELTVITEDNKTLHLKAGDSIVELVNKKHYGKNEGTQTAEIIVFYAGIIDKSITIK